VQARSHPNVLAASAWLNQLYHVPAARSSNSAAQPEDYRPDPLSYADRFRIRRAGGNWDYHRPHVDGESIYPRTIFQGFDTISWLQAEALSGGRIPSLENGTCVYVSSGIFVR